MKFMTTAHSAPSPDKLRILIIGAGFIAREYVKALQAMGCTQIGILSRSEASAAKLAGEYGLSASYGGGEEALTPLLSQYDAFIVAVSIETLPRYAELLAAAGAPRVLLEKPCFLSSAELEDFLKRHPSWPASIALNRLYYPSVARLREVIASEGITSADFSFTEWTHRIIPADYTARALTRWGLSNCIHVISTVFDLIGLPAQMHTAQHGPNHVAWHPSASIFTGHGQSERGAPFSYQADWTSAGRWWVTIRTPRGAYKLCPMEGAEFTPMNSVRAEEFVPVWSGEVKCGFTPMLEAWLAGDGFTLPQLLPHLKSIESIFGYASK